MRPNSSVNLHWRPLFTGIFSFLFIGAALNLRSAPITWSTATNITADTDVLTTGVLAYAYAWGNIPSTVNTVPFASPGGPAVAGTNIFASSQLDVDTTDFFSASNPSPRFLPPTNISSTARFSFPPL
jgi:hypothetical protein